MYKTVLARVLNQSAVYNPDWYSIVELVKLPREAIRVRNAALTQEQFNELKSNAAFILIETINGESLPRIVKVIKPAFDTRLKDAV